MNRSSATKLKVARKESLCRRVVFVDGLARSGKGLVLRILSHLKGGQHWQLHGSIQNLCYAHFLGSVTTEFAAGYVQCIVEENTYNWIVGRNLNTRASDDSCIYKAANADEFIRRAAEPDGWAAVEKFRGDGLFPVFDLHSTLRSAPLIFEALPWAEYVHIVRHPVEQAYRWHARGWGVREIEDPLSFDLLIETSEGRVPWYAVDWAGQFLGLEPMERVVEGVLRLREDDERGYQALGEKQKQVLRVCFEHLVFDPDPVVARISDFLRASVLSPMRAMLSEERCPRPNDLEARRKTFDEVAKAIPTAAAERLHRAAKAYEERWAMPSIVP
jgi:hypothetical protein